MVDGVWGFLRRMGGRISMTGALLVTIGVVSSAAAADGVVEKQLARIDGELLERRWQSALNKLDQLVANEEHLDALRGRAPRVLDAYRESLFWLKEGAIPVHKLLYGEPSLATSNLMFKLEYDEKGKDDELHDLLDMTSNGEITLPTVGEGWGATGYLQVFLRPHSDFPNEAPVALPLEFDGGFTFEVIGTILPANHDDEPRIEFGSTPDLIYRVSSRWARTGGRIERCEDGRCTVIEDRYKPVGVPRNKQKECSVKLRVRRDDFLVSFDEEKPMPLDKERGVFGRVGLDRFSRIKELRAEGKVSREWVDSIHDAWRERDRRLTGRDPLWCHDVPAWLLAAAGPEANLMEEAMPWLVPAAWSDGAITDLLACARAMRSEHNVWAVVASQLTAVQDDAELLGAWAEVWTEAELANAYADDLLAAQRSGQLRAPQLGLALQLLEASAADTCEEIEGCEEGEACAQVVACEVLQAGLANDVCGLTIRLGATVATDDASADRRMLTRVLDALREACEG